MLVNQIFLSETFAVRSERSYTFLRCELKSKNMQNIIHKSGKNKTEYKIKSKKPSKTQTRNITNTIFTYKFLFSYYRKLVVSSVKKEKSLKGSEKR